MSVCAWWTLYHFCRSMWHFVNIAYFITIKELDSSVQKLSLCPCCHYGSCHKLTGLASIKRELSGRPRKQKLQESQFKHKREACEACASHTASWRLNLLNCVKILLLLPKWVSSIAIRTLHFGQIDCAGTSLRALEFPIVTWLQTDLHVSLHICKQLQAQNDEGQCDAARQDCYISVGKSSHHYYSMSSIQTDTFLFIHALYLFFCLFHLIRLHKVISDWSIRLLIFCVREKVMQCSTQLLHTHGIWVRGPWNWTILFLCWTLANI